MSWASDQERPQSLNDGRLEFYQSLLKFIYFGPKTSVRNADLYICYFRLLFSFTLINLHSATLLARMCTTHQQ